MPRRAAGTATAPTFEYVMGIINEKFQPTDRVRMMARLLENQTLDVWMTFQLMEAALLWVQNNKPNDIQITVDETIQTRDQASSTSAKLLNLKNQPVDSFYNFQSIRWNGAGQAAARHQNRPDGMFLLDITAAGGQQDMVVFYEGDVHGKDDGKSPDKGCTNSHKMFQAIAQAQSKNPRMAGGVIFAAMQFSPTDQTTVFLDDMMKAHIFVSIAIADWNSKVVQTPRPVTLMSTLFGNLGSSSKYDFVCGITSD